MDGDGKLDIISSTIELNGQRNEIDLPTNLRVFHIKTSFPVKNIKWGGYMGSHYDGVFRKERRAAKVSVE